MGGKLSLMATSVGGTPAIVLCDGCSRPCPDTYTEISDLFLPGGRTFFRLCVSCVDELVAFHSRMSIGGLAYKTSEEERRLRAALQEILADRLDLTHVAAYPESIRRIQDVAQRALARR